MRAAGVTVVYMEGRGAETFDRALESLRKGDGLTVVRLADLAPNRKQFRLRWKAVHAKGCHVVEQSTGRASNTKAREDMLFDGTESLVHAGKGHDPEKAREFGARGGRPGFKWSKEQAAMIEGHWYDMRHATNPDAIKAINRDLAAAGSKRRLTVNYVWRMMEKKHGNGASGRISGPRRKSVAKLKR